MKVYRIILLIVFIILSSATYAQDKKVLKNNNNEKKNNQSPKANAGDDIKAFPGETISISGLKSIDPEGGRIQYIWSFPPALIFKNDYRYNMSDHIYVNKNDNSIEKVETYTKSFLLDVPESLPVGSKYNINLVVKDREGLSSNDSFTLEIIMPDTSMIDDEKDSDLITSVNENREVDQEKYTNIAIQAISSGSVAPIQESAINYMIYNILKDFGINNIINPVEYIPDTFYKIKASNNIESTKLPEYNPLCLTDSCASQNAILLNASHVLTWTVNEHSLLIVKFFNAKDYLSNPINLDDIDQVDLASNPLSGSEVVIDDSNNIDGDAVTGVKNLTQAKASKGSNLSDNTASKDFLWSFYSLPINPKKAESLKLSGALSALINKNGIFELEAYFISAIQKILPKQKLSLSNRLKIINKKFSRYFSDRPLLVAIILFGGFQVTSELANNNSLGTPPDWPF
tara:strand:+ start:6416 stop:7789 length:1374 start_codon:yes stop_codon:yes gene_type:complete